ncbi:hypothetical protein [Streptomyces sp. NRRL S-118]|uniref:hypothetical protein n=1 Tax=Streptomyces sp. NRRL S-118 TaxID=1463881 RepID=UPI0004CA1ABE|nr:hypothetical protein [Streptomyces sp. NRRL S-118]
MALLRALERTYGPAATWSLRFQAALSQVESMRRLMGEEYGPFLDCCVASFSRVYARIGRPMHPADAILDELRDRYGDADNEVVDVGYALVFGLQVILAGHGYEDFKEFIRVAADVPRHSPSPAVVEPVLA